MYNTCTTYIQQIYNTCTRHIQHIYNDVCINIYNNTYTTTYFKHLCNNIYTTTNLQQHLYNYIYTTTHVYHKQQHRNGMFTTTSSQHIYNQFTKCVQEHTYYNNYT